MIKKRDKPIIENNDIKEVPIVNKNIEFINTGTSKKHKYSLNNCKSREEEVLMTLEVLEKEQGINLYDPNNYPGMWLKNSKNKESRMKNLFVRSDLIDKSDTKTKDDNNNNIPINLKNFFRNGKK
jgi:hypothetical protein